MTDQEAPGSESGSQSAIEPSELRARSGDPRRICLPWLGERVKQRNVQAFWKGRLAAREPGQLHPATQLAQRDAQQLAQHDAPQLAQRDAQQFAQRDAPQLVRYDSPYHH